MIQIERDPDRGLHHFMLRADRSLSRRQIGIFLMVSGIVMATVGVSFAALGLWLVLPFSGAEWLILAYAFRYSLNEGSVRETLTVDEAWVVWEKGKQETEQAHRFQRAWLAVDWIKPDYRGHPSRLVLRSHGRQVEVGGFLVESEREALMHELRRILR